MKSIFSLTISLFFVLNLNATDLIVTTSGQTGTYTTLSSALVAANSGDRILISNIITLYENDTIDKSVTIHPLNSGSRFIVVGSITVKAEANTEIRIVGMELTGDVKSISGSANGYNLCQFYMIDCEILNGYDINCDVSGLALNLMYSNMPNLTTEISFRQGKLIANNINGYFKLMPGDNVNYEDTTSIIANRIFHGTTYGHNGGINTIDNNDHYFLIANNFFGATTKYLGGSLKIFSSNLSPIGENNILNNTHIDNSDADNVYGCNISFHKSYLHNNTNVLNNIFIKPTGSSDPFLGNGVDLVTSGSPKLVRNNVFLVYSHQDYISVGAPVIVAGIIIDSLNYMYNIPSNVVNINIDIPFGFSSAPGTGKQINDMNDIGENFPKYYDIDLTRNDPGTYGGPYSWDNYWNTNNGRARIYELDAPFELPPNQTFNIKSSASHNH